MDILFLFSLIFIVLFFISMFFGYRDAVRSSTPKGPLSMILNKFKNWHKTDDSGATRGVVWRQPFIFKLLIAFAFATLASFLMWFLRPAESVDITGGWVTGVSGWFLYAIAILAGLMLSSLWPAVKRKAIEAKDNTFKGEENHRESKKEEVKEQPKEAPKQEDKPAPSSEKKKGDDPNDIINDYLS